MLLYSIFAFFDYAIYSMVRFVVKLIMLIANYDFFEQEVIGDFAHKVYIVLGVVMLFKIVITAVQYLINPDTFDDREKGMGGLLKKMIISMLLLVAVEPIFSFALYMQKSIVSTIPGIILESGENYKIENSTPVEGNSSDAAQKDPLNSIGEQVAFATISTFTSPKTDTTKDGKTRVIKDEEDMSEKTLDSWRNGILSGCDGSLIGGKLINLDICNYDYMFGISTAAGVFLLYVMLSMTLDVGIRAIKLGILQMLAPIPISSYIVSKDKLTKFVKLAGKVYTDLFIRLGVLYFIVFFIQKVITSIGNSVEVGAGYQTSAFETGFVKVAIIIALFMFAKNAPKFICEVLGVDGGGFGDMADMFKPAWQRAGGAFGAFTNPASNAISNWRQAKANGEGHVARALRAMAGAGRGVADAFAGAANGDDWKQARARHDRAKQKSNEHSIQRMNKKNSKNLGKSTRDRAKEFYETLLGKKEKFVTESDREQAARNYDQRVNNLKTLADRIQNEKDPNKRRELVEQYRNETSALNDRNQFIEKESVRLAAERQVGEKVAAVDKRIADYQNQIGEIDKKIAAGGMNSLENAALLAERADIEEKINSANNEKEKLTQSTAIADAEDKINRARGQSMAVDKQLATAYKNMQNVKNIISASEKVIADGNTELANIESKMGALDPSSSEYENLASQKATIENRIAIAQDKLDKAHERENIYSQDITRLDKAKVTINANKETAEKARSEAISKREAQVQTLVDEYNSYSTQIDKAKAEWDTAEATLKATQRAIFQSNYTAGINSFFGGSSPSGKGYLDLSSFLGDSRSSIYTGEAMTKLRQNADILVDVNGNPVRYTSKYCDKPIKYSYEEMSALLNDVKASKIDIETLKTKYGFSSSAILQSAFEDVEKQAAKDYIDANLYHAYPGSFTDKDGNATIKVRLKRPTEINSAVVQWWDTFANDLYKNGVSKKELDDLMTEFKKDPGKFIAGASSLKDKYKTIGKRIVDSAKPDDGKK